MTVKIDNLMRNYSEWLFQNTSTRKINNTIEITLPYLDRNNDCIQIYLKEQKDGKLLLTDDGYTVTELQRTGFTINSERNQIYLQDAATSFSITLTKENELQTITTEADFPQNLNNLIQVIQQFLRENMQFTAEQIQKRYHIPANDYLNY